MEMEIEIKYSYDVKQLGVEICPSNIWAHVGHRLI